MLFAFQLARCRFGDLKHRTKDANWEKAETETEREREKLPNKILIARSIQQWFMPASLGWPAMMTYLHSFSPPPWVACFNSSSPELRVTLDTVQPPPQSSRSKVQATGRMKASELLLRRGGAPVHLPVKFYDRYWNQTKFRQLRLSDHH